MKSFRSMLYALCSMLRKSRQKLLCTLMLLSIAAILRSQDPLGTWKIINAKLALTHRFSIFGEGQIRSVKFLDDFFYFEIKGGLTYSLNENIALTAGTGRYHTYNTTKPGNFIEPLAQGETRTWLQLIMEQYLDKIHFEHRYRAEQRFTTNGYRNRFRYRINVLYPINHREIIPQTLYASVADEVFFNNNPPFYERNRFFAGLGYKISSTFVIQSGFMRQYDYKLESASHRNFLQTSLLLSFSLKEKKEPSIPSTTD